MAIPPPVSEILITISSIPLKDALAYIIALGLLGKLNEKIYSPIKQAIKDKWSERQFAFVPNKKEAIKLKKLQNNSQYVAFKKLLPRSQYSDLIRTGLLIKDYHDDPTSENKERTKEIKMNISRRPNGKTYLGIIRLASTPQYFDTVLNELYRLQKEGYTQKHLYEEFEEIIKEWDKCHLAVKNQSKKSEIISFCKNHVVNKADRFFLIGMMHASEIIEKSLKELTDLFEENGYIVTIYSEEGGIEPRTEVIVKRKSAFIEFEE